jgi:hypothetical protein
LEEKMDILNEAAFVTGFLNAIDERAPLPGTIYPETSARIRAVVDAAERGQGRQDRWLERRSG